MLNCSRELLKAPRTYYVRTDGNDSNTGLTNDAAGAFLTIQKAVNVTLETVDLGGFNVTIQVGDGTYTAGVIVRGPQTGTGTITIQGNATTPGNVIVSTSGSSILVDNRATLIVRDMELRTSTNGVCLQILTASTCYFQNIRFGPSAIGHIQAASGTWVVPTGSYTISGSAPNHLLITHGGSVYAVGVTVTLTGTPNWSDTFVHMELCGTFRAEAFTFSGAATGKRYNVVMNSTLQTYGAGPNYLPGSIAGTTATGGQYT
jgi:hypothetical protein